MSEKKAHETPAGERYLVRRYHDRWNLVGERSADELQRILNSLFRLGWKLERLQRLSVDDLMLILVPVVGDEVTAPLPAPNQTELN